MKNILMRLSAFLLAATLVSMNTLTLRADSVKAKTTVTMTGSGTAIRVKSLSYDLEQDAHDDDMDNVEIDFATKVRWKNASVSTTDENNKSYDTSIEEKDSDDLSLAVDGLAKGHSYKIVIKGIKASAASSYGTLSISFAVPKDKKDAASASKIKISSTDYDREDRELDIDFATRITLRKNASVTVKDAAGRLCDAEIIDYDSDDCTIAFYDALKRNATYTLTIKGIKEKTASHYGSLTMTFTADDHEED